MSWKSLECRKRTALLARYSDNPAALLDGERADLERHLDRCPECRRELEIISGVGVVLRAHVPPPAEASSELWNRLEAQIRADAPRLPQRTTSAVSSRRPVTPSSTFSRWGIALPVAALATMAVFGTMVRHQQVQVVPEAANLREASVTARSSMPVLPSGVWDEAEAGASIGALEEPIRVMPSPRKKIRVQKEALTAARRAAAEARAAAGLQEERRPARAHNDPFQRGATAFAARHGLPKPASAAPPVPSSGSPRPVPTEPRMLALAEKPSPASSSSVPATSSDVTASTPPVIVAKPRPTTGPGLDNGLEGPTPLIVVAANTSPAHSEGEAAGPGASGDEGTTGRKPVTTAASVSRDRTAAAMALSPTEAVNLHNRQRSLFLNYGSAQR